MSQRNRKITWKVIRDILKETGEHWIDAKSPRLAAALAYYTIFSAAPLLIIVVGVAGIVFGAEAAQGRLVEQIQGLVGRDGAEAIQTMLRNSSRDSEGILATVIGFITLIVGATGTFIELQDALNTIWGVRPKPGRGVMGLLRDRLLSFAMILGIGFMLLVLLVVSAGLAAVGDFIGRYFTDTTNVIILEIVNIVISLVFITIIFALIFKILPDVTISWNDVLIGAAITSTLFTIGKYLIGLYLGQSSLASTYGAAGSLAILFVWVYYSSLILFFGAVFTQVYANRFGSQVRPAKNAVYVGNAACDIGDPMPKVKKQPKPDDEGNDEMMDNTHHNGGAEDPEARSDHRQLKIPPPPDSMSAKGRSLPRV